MLQRNVFLDGEGDAWFKRNISELSDYSSEDDFLFPLLDQLPIDSGSSTSILEVGCGQGFRLHEISITKSWKAFGIDPSKEAVASATRLGLDVKLGTANYLEYPSRSFDIVVFGFCLYLCDRDDLFQIAQEAHRVLKDSGWLLILDFWSDAPRQNPYSHNSMIKSYKSDLSSMFTWHPFYTLMDHKVRHHSSRGYTDDSDQWMAATVIRKSNSL